MQRNLDELAEEIFYQDSIKTAISKMIENPRYGPRAPNVKKLVKHVKLKKLKSGENSLNVVENQLLEIYSINQSFCIEDNSRIYREKKELKKERHQN